MYWRHIARIYLFIYIYFKSLFILHYGFVAVSLGPGLPGGLW
jgi:hypothetical protein